MSDKIHPLFRTWEELNRCDQRLATHNMLLKNQGVDTQDFDICLYHIQQAKKYIPKEYRKTRYEMYYKDKER